MTSVFPEKRVGSREFRRMCLELVSRHRRALRSLTAATACFPRRRLLCRNMGSLELWKR